METTMKNIRLLLHNGKYMIDRVVELMDDGVASNQKPNSVLRIM